MFGQSRQSREAFGFGNYFSYYLFVNALGKDTQVKQPNLSKNENILTPIIMLLFSKSL